MIIQVVVVPGSGRRVFRMAPIHHHFELVGWPEFTVIVRFWIIAGLAVAFGLGLFYADFIARGRSRDDAARASRAGAWSWSAAGASGRGRRRGARRRGRATCCVSESRPAGASSTRSRACASSGVELRGRRAPTRRTWTARRWS